MNFIAKKLSEADRYTNKVFSQYYLDQTFTGTPIDLSWIMKLVSSKQGSNGIEEALCTILGCDINQEKHGFDGRNPKTGVMIELKPSSSTKITYNDVTIKKVHTLMKTHGNLMIFETHVQGKLKLIVQVSGKLIAQILLEKYNVKRGKILSGAKIGTRQTHTISLLSFVTRFGAHNTKVLFYRPDDVIPKSVVKILNLTQPVNKLGV